MSADTETPRWQAGTWTLTAPDGRTWQADSPLKCCGAEQRERVPPEVALARIFKACDEAPQLPELPPIPVNKQIGYELIPYVAGYRAEFVHEYAIAYAELCLATQPQAPQGAVTPGFRLLPIEPTMEMYEAAGEELYGHSREKSIEWAKEDKFESYAQTGMEAWRAMVKVAPETPEVQK